jgi:hypothetical protein
VFERRFLLSRARTEVSIPNSYGIAVPILSVLDATTLTFDKKARVVELTNINNKGRKRLAGLPYNLDGIDRRNKRTGMLEPGRD